MFIKTFRFFLTIILFSSLVVWLSNNPGKVEILWKNYLLETNLLGIVSVFFFLILFVLLLINIFSSLRNITKNFESRKNKRYLKLADESLDNIAEGLLLGDSTSIEKNSRMIKKYLNNDLFSSFMLFNSSLIRNDLEESLKYLRVLESIPRAKYIAQRGKVIVMLKKNENTKAKETLIEFCKQYPNDHWFHDKLSRMYALEDNWKLAHDSINNLKNISNILKVNLANLKILSGGSQLEAYYLSSNSVLVVKETVKFYINQSNLKKASEVINKTWRKLLCIELIETFMQYRVKDDKEILKRYKLVICDEAFLALTPNGEQESLVQLTKLYDNLIVLRSLTKIFNIPGLRLGYAIGASNKLKQWKISRDPWPLNSFAVRAGIDLLSNKTFYEEWIKRIHTWINTEKRWVHDELSKIEDLKIHNSSTNFFLIQSKYSLSPNIKYLEKKGILIRECSSFKFLDEKWARISLQSKENNSLLCEEIQNSFKK